MKHNVCMKKIENDENLFILGISWFATSGKDTFGAIAKNILEKNGVDAYIYNFAEELKVIANLIIKPYLGIDCINPTKDEKKKIRKVLVGVGQGFRDVDEFFWVKTVAQKIKNLDLDKINFIITSDVRNLNEAEWIHAHKHGFILSIEREGVIPPNEHEAENIPKIRDNFADFSVKWPNIELDEKNILTEPSLCAIVHNILEKIHGRNISRSC